MTSGGRLALLSPAPGDTIYVTRDDGRKLTFTVDGVRDFLKAKFPTSLVYGGHGAVSELPSSGDLDAYPVIATPTRSTPSSVKSRQSGGSVQERIASKTRASMKLPLEGTVYL
jgi:hypothetical protein